jgi:hypothetical protein
MYELTGPHQLKHVIQILLCLELASLPPQAAAQ